MCKILLTGASGFIGQTIKHVLSEYTIFSLARNHCDINVDLSKEIPVLPISDIIVHAAGKAHSMPKQKLKSKSFSM